MATLKALETLALERGRVSTGDVFELHNEDAAAELIASGRAEASTEDAPAAPTKEVPPHINAKHKTK